MQERLIDLSSRSFQYHWLTGPPAHRPLPYSSLNPDLILWVDFEAVHLMP